VTTDLLFYSEKRFYRPRVPLWGMARMQNLGILMGCGDLIRIESEKGEEGKSDEALGRLRAYLDI